MNILAEYRRSVRRIDAQTLLTVVVLGAAMLLIAAKIAVIIKDVYCD